MIIGGSNAQGDIGDDMRLSARGRNARQIVRSYIRESMAMRWINRIGLTIFSILGIWLAYWSGVYTRAATAQARKVVEPKIFIANHQKMLDLPNAGEGKRPPNTERQGLSG